MGSCITKPGCPPCDRYRSFKPQWDGDLCNLGYSVVKTDDVVKNGVFIVPTVKPTDLVDEAVNRTMLFASNKTEDVITFVGNKTEATIEVAEKMKEEAAAIVSIMMSMGQIIVGVVAVVILLYIVIKLYSGGRACYICFKKAATRHERGGGDGAA